MTTKIALLLVTFSAAAVAQTSSGYAFFAPGGASCCGTTAMTLHVGAGGEGIVGKGIGVGAEIGAMGPRQDFTAAWGVFSPDVSYHFRHQKSIKADPFVNGGYTLFFRNGTGNLFNYGAGLNYWFSKSLGLRVEFRDHVWTQGNAEHYWGVRMGLAFR